MALSGDTMDARRVKIFPVLLLVLALCVDAGVPTAAAQTDTIPFDRLPGADLIRFSDGMFVYRDSASWAEEVVPFWPEMYVYVDGEYQLAPPPHFDFSDSLIIFISYGTSGCSRSGGNVESITHNGQTATVRLGPIYINNPICAADIPRGDIVRVSKSDVPDDVEIVFQPREEGYSTDPRHWYPLAVGNAWSYVDWSEVANPTRVESIDTTLAVGELQWYRVRQLVCEAPACAGHPTRWLSWTGDHYLLQADETFSSIDTLHNTVPRSIFTVNVPVDTTLEAETVEGTGTERIRVHIYLWRGDPVADRLNLYVAAEDVAGEEQVEASYLYGYGPADAAGAVIGLEHLGNTSAIELALDAPELPRVLDDMSIDVYPSPVAGDATLSVRAPASGPARVTVFDVLGRRIGHRDAVLIGGVEWTSRWSDFQVTTPGLYLIRVIDAGGKIHQTSVIVAR